MGAGDIGAVISTLEFDTTACYENQIVHITGDIYAIAYRAGLMIGYIKTVNINSVGTISAVIGTFDPGANAWGTPFLFHISGTMYAVAYNGPGADGWLKTLTISSAGAMVATGNSLEFDTGFGAYPHVIHISGEVYAIVYEGNQNDGWLKTVTITDAGVMALTGNSLEFDAVNGKCPEIIHISGNNYAITYSGIGLDGFLITLSISDAGVIGAIIDTYEYDTTKGEFSRIVHISGETYAIVYEGDVDDGYLKTFTIHANGQIDEPAEDTFEFAPSRGEMPHMCLVKNHIYAVVYEGDDSFGTIKTITINDDGSIDEPYLDSSIFDGVQGRYPYITNISGKIYAISYRGTDGNGFIITLPIGGGGGGGSSLLPFIKILGI